MNASVLSCFINIFVDPKQALTDVRGHTAWLWYPFLTTMILGTAVLLWYNTTADLDSLRQQILAVMGTSKYSADQLEQIRNSLTRGRFIFQAIAGGTIAVIIIHLAHALYFFLVSKVAGYEVQEFGKWFNFVSWASFPNVLIYVAMTLTYLFSRGNPVSVYDLNVTSLNVLIFHFKPGTTWFSMASSIGLTTFWILGLMVLGLSLWTKRSIGKSAMVVLAPYVVIYGLIFALKLT